MEVGSGTYHWSCTLPEPARAPLTLDRPLIDLVSDADAWDAMLRAAPAFSGLEIWLRGRGDMPVHEAISLLADARALRAAAETELARLRVQRAARASTATTA
jgi:hypothetical protein